MFQTPLDIANRALQHLGAPRIGAFTDNSPGAQEMVFSYDKVRQAELRRNLWQFATRQTALRALDTASRLVSFPAFSSATIYAGGQIVTSGGLTWISLVDGNVGNLPGLAAVSGPLVWDVYFGPTSADPWNFFNTENSFSNNESYHLGELAYQTPGDGSYKVYASLVEGNQNEPNTVDVWSATQMYSVGAVVSYNSINYQSRVALNYDFEPDVNATQWTTVLTNPAVSGSWSQITGATLSTNPIVYPLTAGPYSDTDTRNAFRLPSGFLRPAPQDPKAGVNAWLGAHVGMGASGWIYQGGYIITSFEMPAIVFRFVCDVQDVTTMDPMFCEGLAARLAMESAPTLAPDRLQACMIAYQRAMSDARTVDSIETGPVEPNEDEYITVRY